MLWVLGALSLKEERSELKIPLKAHPIKNYTIMYIAPRLSVPLFETPEVTRTLPRD